MQPSVSRRQASDLTARKIAKSVSDLIADWSPEDVFDAHQILDENPELKDDQSVVLDLAYEEYCRRTECGEEIDVSEFAARFPAVETPLLDLIDVHQVLYDNPSVLTNGVSPRWPVVGESHLDLKLLENIGSGSFSQVYLASERGVGERRVVAKLCTNANHEASLLGRLEHPNIVPILSVKTDRQKNLSAICMPYMSRTTLAHAVEFLHRPGRQSTCGDLFEMLFEREHATVSTTGRSAGFFQRSQLQDVMVDIAVQLCRGLEFAHSRGVIHGDLKPSNILLTKQGTALLMDFNLSQQLRPESHALGGTLAYMAPEQLAILCQTHRQPQSVSCNEQTDVYSFGVLLTELLTGSHPFCKPHRQRDTPAESARMLFEQQQAKPVTASHLAPAIDLPLAKVIEKCLTLDPRERWGDVQALRAALEQTLTLKSRALRRLRRERKRVVAVSAGLSFSLVAASLIYASLPHESERLVAAATMAMDHDRPEDAIRALTRARDLEAQRLGTPTRETDSLLVKAYDARGNQFLKADRYSQAINQFNKARRLEPSSESVRKSLLDAYLQSGAAAFAEKRASDAVADFSQARKLAPGSPEILQRLSRALLADRRFEEATETAEDWRSREPDNARSVANLAYCYFMQGQRETGKPEFLKARKEFRQALGLPGDVSRAAILNNIGLCKLKLGQTQQALEPLSEALEASPDYESPEGLAVPFVLSMKAQLALATADRYYWKQERDLRWIQDYVARAPESADLYVEAACWYAFASRENHVDRKQSQQFLEECIDWCHRASALGATKRDLNKILTYQGHLKAHPDWPLLMGATIEENESETVSSLLEPLL